MEWTHHSHSCHRSGLLDYCLRGTQSGNRSKYFSTERKTLLLVAFSLGASGFAASPPHRPMRKSPALPGFYISANGLQLALPLVGLVPVLSDLELELGVPFCRRFESRENLLLPRQESTSEPCFQNRLSHFLVPMVVHFFPMKC